jgi:hypothetical protein
MTRWCRRRGAGDKTSPRGAALRRVNVARARASLDELPLGYEDFLRANRSEKADQPVSSSILGQCKVAVKCMSQCLCSTA